MEELPASRPEQMPRATTELVVLDRAIRAFCRSASPKRRRRFLRAFFEELAMDDGDNVIPFRQRDDVEREREKAARAVAWARSRLPVWMASEDG